MNYRTLLNDIDSYKFSKVRDDLPRIWDYLDQKQKRSVIDRIENLRRMFAKRWSAMMTDDEWPWRRLYRLFAACHNFLASDVSEIGPSIDHFPDGYHLTTVFNTLKERQVKHG